MTSVQAVRDFLEKSGMKIRDIRPLSGGDESDTYLCDERYVVKIPKHESVKESQALEFQLYHFLESCKLYCEVPKVIYQSETCNIMTFIQGSRLSYECYHQLNEVEKDELAYDEATFLQQLHAISLPDSHPLFRRLKQDTKDRFLRDKDLLKMSLDNEKLLTPHLMRWIDRIYQELLSMSYLFEYKACLVHNDFSADNMIFRKNRLAGVIDFGDAIVGDPDNDFLCLLDNSTDDFGKDFGRRVLNYYEHPNPELAERKAEIQDAYWPIQQIIFGSIRQDRKLFQNGLQKIETVRF